MGDDGIQKELQTICDRVGDVRDRAMRSPIDVRNEFAEVCDQIRALAAVVLTVHRLSKER
jgi:hypothetical protein